MQYLDTDITVLYSKLLEQLRDDTREGIPSYGSLVKKNVNGKTYWYHQYRFLGKQIQKSLGADIPVEEWRAALRKREELCAVLASGGMQWLAPNSQAANILGLLLSARVFDTGAVLIGSYAFGAMCNMLGIRVNNQLTTTQDFDFGIDRSIKLTTDNPQFEKVLIQAGMHPIPGFDKPPTASSFRTPDKSVKVDFLTPSKSGATGKAVRLRQHGVHADELKYLDYLIKEPTSAALITKYSTLVRIPQPARFAFHKLIVATQRPVTDEAKRKKDIAQASLILSYLVENRPHDLAPAWEGIAKHKSWKKLALQASQWLELNLRQDERLPFNPTL